MQLAAAKLSSLKPFVRHITITASPPLLAVIVVVVVVVVVGVFVVLVSGRKVLASLGVSASCSDSD